MTWIEAVATICGLLCVWLTIIRNIWCWPTGLVQVILYIFIFYRVRLYSDLILQVIYVVMQLYGWHYWLHGGRDRSELPVSDMRPAPAAAWWAAGCVITIPWGWLMGTYAKAALPYPDGFITVMSLIAQWLMARKKVESWHFWIAVDVVAIGVYWLKELYLTTGLYAVFLVLAVMGLRAWRRELRRLREVQAPTPVPQPVAGEVA